MQTYKEKERFAVIAETELDKVVLTALMETLPYEIEGDYTYFQDRYYQSVMNFINDVEESFNDALCNLHEELENEV